MPFIRRSILATALAAGIASPALAGNNPVAVLDVSGSSFINAEISTFIGSVMATDNGSSVMGTLSLSSSDFSTVPGDLELVDLDLMLVPAAMPTGAVDGGKFLGSAGPVGLRLEGVSLAPDKCSEKDGVSGPEESGALATFPVHLSLTGEAFATYDLIAIEPAEDATINLASLDPSNATLEIFTVNSMMGELTVEATLFFETVRIPFEPGLVEVSLTSNSNMSITATGDDPGPGAEPNFCSRVDLAEPCGTLDLADVVAFVSGFGAQDPLSDLDDSGTFDLQDVVGFVNAFSSDNCDPNGQYYCYGYGGGYAAIEFHEGNAAYAFGDHTTLTAGIAVSGAALMLGFGSFRRKLA